MAMMVDEEIGQNRRGQDDDEDDPKRPDRPRPDEPVIFPILRRRHPVSIVPE
jgi:hypothetical protein